jgi:ADP-ribose pyrophosphatase YjhB (NUDIX family)
MGFARKALGSAGALLTPDGRVLLVRRAYEPHDWVMPGGNANEGESPVATLRREVREEVGLDVSPSRLTGVYYQGDHRAGEFVHFVFEVPIPPDPPVDADLGEVAEWGLFDHRELPEPMSTSTRLRLTDAMRPSASFLPIDLPSRSEP